MQRICGPFLKIYLCFSRDFVNQHVFFCSIYIETARNSREECNEFADLLFFRLSLCLSRDSLSCDTRSLDLCILFKFGARERTEDEFEKAKMAISYCHLPAPPLPHDIIQVILNIYIYRNKGCFSNWGIWQSSKDSLSDFYLVVQWVYFRRFHLTILEFNLEYW